MLVKSRAEQPSTSVLSRKRTILLCIGCFCTGIIFTSGLPEPKSITRTALEAEQLKLVSEGCDSKIGPEGCEVQNLMRTSLGKH
ncbi:unnamed protein product [Camellia sinensis]